ncbi:hypothetical protein EMMF5_004215 [Cystobasidiomycetes sp. EMM_F5]
MPSAFVETAVGALQATISVLLVLFYGAASVKWLKIVSPETVDGVTRLGTNILLPALLFSQMGKQASADKLVEYWILPVSATVFTLLSLMYAWIGVNLLRMPNWMYPAAAFPNMLSLPLLMVQALAKTGTLGKLLTDPDDSIDDALDRAKVYFLVSALAGNIIRFAIGPRLLQQDDDDDKIEGPNTSSIASRDPERQSLLGRITPGAPIPGQYTEDDSLKARIWKHLSKLSALKGFFNPPLIAGLLAIFFGVIPGTHKLLFEESGALNSSLTQSIKTVGDLYTGLQIFVLGGKLVSKNVSRPRLFPLLYLFAWRFVFMPAIATALVYTLRTRYPDYIKADPILDFVLAISHVGPPAITLIAMADLSGLDSAEQGVIATILLASYVVTPFMSVSVSAIIVAISIQQMSICAVNENPSTVRTCM